MDLQNFLLFVETTFNIIAEIGDSVRLIGLWIKDFMT